jgi:hypothetical protein
LDFTNLPWNLSHWSLHKFKGRAGAPGGAGEFAAGEGAAGPGQQAGEGVRRGPAVVTAGRTAPASCWPGSTHRGRGKLHGVLEKGLGVPTSLESRRRYKLGEGDLVAAAGARTPASWGSGLSNK